MNLLPFCPRHAHAIIAQSGSLLRYRRTFSVFYCVKGVSKRLATTGFRLDPRIYCAIVTLFAISIALSLHLSGPRQGRPRQSCSGKGRARAWPARDRMDDGRNHGAHEGEARGDTKHDGDGQSQRAQRTQRMARAGLARDWMDDERETTEAHGGGHGGARRRMGDNHKEHNGHKGGVGGARAGLDGRRGGTADCADWGRLGVGCRRQDCLVEGARPPPHPGSAADRPRIGG